MKRFVTCKTCNTKTELPNSVEGIYVCRTCGFPNTLSEYRSPKPPVKEKEKSRYKKQGKRKHGKKKSRKRKASKGGAGNVLFSGCMLFGAIAFAGFLISLMFLVVFIANISPTNEDSQQARSYVDVNHKKGVFEYIRKPLDGNWKYTCRSLDVEAEVNGNLEIIADDADIERSVFGDVIFKGEKLTVDSRATITGDLILDASKHVEISGIVEGSISGTFKQISAGKRTAFESSGPEFDAVIEVRKRQDVLAKIETDRIEREKKFQKIESDLKPESFHSDEIRQIASQVLGSPGSRNSIGKLILLDAVDEDRDNVVALALLQLREIRSAEVFEVLKQWGTEENVEEFMQLLDPGKVSASAWVDVLIAWQAKDKIISLFNHKDSVVRARAKSGILAWKVDDEALAWQCVRDLDKMESSFEYQYYGDILGNLKTLKVEDAKLKSEINKRLAPLLSRARYSDEALDVLERTMTPDDVQLIVKHDSHFGRDRIDLILSKIDTPEAVEAVVERTLRTSSTRAINSLIDRMGNDLETYLWKHLPKPKYDSKTYRVEESAVRILGEIGTEISLKHLRSVPDESRLKDKADQAISRIETRMKRGKNSDEPMKSSSF